MFEGGLSIHTCFHHVFATTFISKWTSKVVQGNARKMSKAQNKLSSTLPSPCCPWPFCVPDFTYPQLPTHTHTHFTSSRQPSALSLSLLVLCPWSSLSSIYFPELLWRRGKAASSNISS